MQKIWNLNQNIINLKNVSSKNEKIKKDVDEKIDLYVVKITNYINNFQFNVCIAQFYEAYKFLNDQLNKNIDKNTLIDNLIKFMKLLMPFVPHLASECLENLNVKENNSWPKIKENILSSLKINMVVQINGKTRDVIEFEQGAKKERIMKEIIKNSKAKKYLENKEIAKIIFVQDKIINYIIKT